MTGRLKAGRAGLFLELDSGERWTIGNCEDLRDHLGEKVEVEGTRTGTRALKLGAHRILAG